MASSERGCAESSNETSCFGRHESLTQRGAECGKLHKKYDAKHETRRRVESCNGVEQQRHVRGGLAMSSTTDGASADGPVKMIPINDIEFVKELYPRFEVDEEVVQRYRNSIDDLPPVRLDEDNRLIDGYHRLRAHRVEGEDEILAVVESVEDDSDFYKRAIEANTRHGHQLNREEKKSLARDLYENGIVERTDLGDLLGVSDSTARRYTDDIYKEQKEDRKQRAVEYYLDYVNYPTQTDVAEADGVEAAQKTVSNWVDSKFDQMNDFTTDPDWLKVDNVWRFQRPDPQYGVEGYDGRIPGQIVGNLLHHYTEPKDLVVDPMAGGGTTVDVCKDMGRRYAAFDLNPLEDKGIVEQNTVEDGIPLDSSVAELVFMDPPYWDLMDDGYVEGGVSSLEYDEWVDAMRVLLEEAADVTRPGGTIAFLIEPFYSDDRDRFFDTTFDVVQAVDDVDIEQRQRISAPMNHGMKNHRDVEQAKENGYLLDLNRDLVVWEVGGGK